MAFHNIQCPHCFTDYTISDARYRANDGVMRCGTCREQFKAILVTEDQTPKFDPRDVFIEPLSEPLPASDGGEIAFSGEPEPSYVSYEKSIDPDTETDVELMSTHEFEYKEPKKRDSSQTGITHERSPSVSSDVLEKYGLSDELSTSQILQNLRKRAHKDSIKQGQLDLELPINDRRSQSTDLKIEPTLDADNNLINEVDKLVDQKLGLAHAEKASTNQTSVKHAKRRPAKKGKATGTQSVRSSNNDFLLGPRKTKKGKENRALRFVRSLLYFLLTIILITLLGYQLWLKQLIQLPTDQAWFLSLEEKSAPYVTPLLAMADQKLSEIGIKLPKRRNLSQLKLLSATTEPHPTRSTTVLLKISLINRADIAQPLPWLEMSLTDTDGRLVARRNLAPTDYIYKNKTDSNIGANELKKITIELLSFPKAATGYGIKLLSK